jgi:hypothetical protein
MSEMDDGKACERAYLAATEYYACKAGIRFSRTYKKANPLKENMRVSWSVFMTRPGDPHPKSAKAVEEAAYNAQEIEDEQAEAVQSTPYSLRSKRHSTRNGTGDRGGYSR